MPSVIAHRGASASCRENTVEAFAEAHRVGADAVELDARLTADGTVAVHHDATLADGRRLGETSSTDLPAHVASLADALDACDGMWVNVELKNAPDEPDFDPDHGVAARVIPELVARGEPERWLLSSFNPLTLLCCRSLAPELRTAWLVLEIDDVVLRRCATDGHAAVHPWVERLAADHVGRAQAEGLEVNTWTCNEPARMIELIAAGVDGICTDVPDIARRVIDGAPGEVW